MEVFPYIAQPAGEECACGLHFRGELSVEERAIVGKGGGDRRHLLGCFAVRILTEKSHLDNLDDLRGGLLNCVHQARDNRCPIFLPGIARYVWESVPAGVEADRRADDKGDALRDRLALGAIVGLPDRGCQGMG